MLRTFLGFLLAVATLARFGDGASKDTQTERTEKQSVHSFCGKSLPPSRSRVRRVIGGDDASAHAWPWQVLILNATSVQCGGSIISPTFLITAAHCVDANNTIADLQLTFYVGKHRVVQKDPHEQKLEVEQIYIHHKYKRGNLTDPGDYDMALVKLKYPINFTEHVHPICLEDVNRFKAGHECVLSGWGLTDLKKTSNTLQEIRLPLVSQKVCNSNESYGGIIHQRYLCAGVAEGGKDGCTYDSGGPLMCSHGETDPWYLVGMMVWGEGCAKKNKYGVYANVAMFMDTINDRVKDLPQPYSPTGQPTPVQTSAKDTTNTEGEKKEKLFIAIIGALSVIIVILLTTLCIVNFYTRGYICCTATEGRHHKAPTILHEQNGKLNREVSV